MRIKFLIIFIILISLVTSCAPSRTFLDTTNHYWFNELNRQIGKGNVAITLMNGNEFKENNVHLSADSLFYSKSGNKYSIPISKIRSIAIPPKFYRRSFIPLIFMGGGFFMLATSNHGNSVYEMFMKYWGGIAALGLGSISFVVVNSNGIHTYYFHKQK